MCCCCTSVSGWFPFFFFFFCGCSFCDPAESVVQVRLPRVSPKLAVCHAETHVKPAWSTPQTTPQNNQTTNPFDHTTSNHTTSNHLKPHLKTFKPQTTPQTTPSQTTPQTTPQTIKPRTRSITPPSPRTSRYARLNRSTWRRSTRWVRWVRRSTSRRRPSACASSPPSSRHGQSVCRPCVCVLCDWGGDAKGNLWVFFFSLVEMIAEHPIVTLFSFLLFLVVCFCY